MNSHGWEPRIWTRITEGETEPQRGDPLYPENQHDKCEKPRSLNSSFYKWGVKIQRREMASAPQLEGKWECMCVAGATRSPKSQVDDHFVNQGASRSKLFLWNERSGQNSLMVHTQIPWFLVGQEKVRKLTLLEWFLLTNTSEFLLSVPSNHWLSGFLILHVWGRLGQQKPKEVKEV